MCLLLSFSVLLASQMPSKILLICQIISQLPLGWYFKGSANLRGYQYVFHIIIIEESNNRDTIFAAQFIPSFALHKGNS